MHKDVSLTKLGNNLRRPANRAVYGANFIPVDRYERPKK